MTEKRKGTVSLAKLTKSPTLDEIRQWPATVDVCTACTAFGISSAYGYELIKSGSFPARTLTLGKVSRVVTASIVALLSEESAA